MFFYCFAQIVFSGLNVAAINKRISKKLGFSSGVKQNQHRFVMSCEFESTDFDVKFHQFLPVYL